MYLPDWLVVLIEFTDQTIGFISNYFELDSVFLGLIKV